MVPRFFFFFVVAFVIVESVRGRESEAKRVTDSAAAKLPPVTGGGKINRALLARLARRSSDLSLLELDEEGLSRNGVPSPDALPQEYVFLREAKYQACFVPDPKGQGESCNSCWAFATQKMMQARMCKWGFDSRFDGMVYTPKPLSPLNLICKLQTDADGGVCGPKDIGAALEFVRDTGIVTAAWFENWKKNERTKALQREHRHIRASIEFEKTMDSLHNRARPHFGDDADKGDRSMPRRMRAVLELEKWHQVNSNTIVTKAMDEASVNAEILVDVSHPAPEKCDSVFNDTTYGSDLVHAPRVMASSGPFRPELLKRTISVGGPVIGIMRLTWEFLVFTGSLFNPPGRQTFCRMAKPNDARDYCSPEREATWDAEQRAQQVRPAAADREAWEETWYNHFITLHGWGVDARSGTPYWVVENSWGPTYQNDPVLGNNGAGGKFPSNETFNHFVLIAESVAGSRGLEFTSRPYFLVRK